jgi:hypothetical protein
MYTRQEASRIKQAFWTTYGQYMRPVPSASGEKVNWVNYKTGIKHLFFRMHANKQKAFIAIELNNQNLTLQQSHWDQLIELKPLLETELQEEWEWLSMMNDEYGKIVSMVKKEIDEVNIFNQDDWPQIISFFKPRIIALDSFWSFARYTFEI